MSMKYIYGICLILFGLVANGSALVHLIPELHPGAHECLENGCEVPGQDVQVQVGEEVQDENTCGVFVCLNESGQGLYQFCQQPVAIAACESEAINTKGNFPDCCWQCVEGVQC